jgi:hypothetical protein
MSCTLHGLTQSAAAACLQDAATVEHLDEIKAGRIELACEVVVPTGSQDTSQPLGKPVVVGDEAARKKLPEGKKW